MRKKAGYKVVHVEVPEGLWAALEADAQRHGRSATAQLAHVLIRAYPRAGGELPRRPGRPRKEAAPSPD